MKPPEFVAINHIWRSSVGRLVLLHSAGQTTATRGTWASIVIVRLCLYSLKRTIDVSNPLYLQPEPSLHLHVV